MSENVFIWDKNSEFLELTLGEFKKRKDTYGEYCIYKGGVYRTITNGSWQYAKAEEIPPEFKTLLMLLGVSYKGS